MEAIAISQVLGFFKKAGKKVVDMGRPPAIEAQEMKQDNSAGILAIVLILGLIGLIYVITKK